MISGTRRHRRGHARHQVSYQKQTSSQLVHHTSIEKYWALNCERHCRTNCSHVFGDKVLGNSVHREVLGEWYYTLRCKRKKVYRCLAHPNRSFLHQQIPPRPRVSADASSLAKASSPAHPLSRWLPLPFQATPCQAPSNRPANPCTQLRAAIGTAQGSCISLSSHAHHTPWIPKGVFASQDRLGWHRGFVHRRVSVCASPCLGRIAAGLPQRERTHGWSHPTHDAPDLLNQGNSFGTMKLSQATHHGAAREC